MAKKKENNGTWTDINNANNATYNPGNISVTTQYRRRAKRVGANCNTQFLNSNVITKTIENTPTNLTCQYRIENNIWVTGDCDVNLSVGQKLRLSVDPDNIESYVWTGPNNFSE